MQKLTRQDLLSLEQYSAQRKGIRERVIAHKRDRKVQVGPNMTWCFEDRETIRYQVQEMLRIERIFEADGIQAELDAYNPLIPDGGNWKATLLIEFPDPQERQRALEELRQVEDRCWVRIGTHAPVFAIADEDLERENEQKTSTVHFLRFELGAEPIRALKAGAALAAGVDHPRYRHDTGPLPEQTRLALLRDLD